MNLVVHDAVVTGFEPLIGSLHLPDLDDLHVLAAAIRARAQIIVTFNLRDFPAEVLADWDVEARHPDDVLVDQFHLDASSMHKAIQAVADSWQRPPGTVDHVLDRLDRLDRAGLPQTAAVLRRLAERGLLARARGLAIALATRSG